jgi:hypothetical protein
MAGKESFQEIFDALKPVLAQYSETLRIQVDKPGQYYLETKSAAPSGPYKGRRLQFGGVKIGKAYVSFHLMPIYMNPKLQAAISPELKKRMQGKSCFNFTHVDPSHISELKKLTKSGFEEFKTWGQKFGTA